MRSVILDLDDTLYPRGRYVQSGFARVARHLAGSDGASASEAFAVLCRAHATAPGHEFQVLCAHLGLPEDGIAAWIALFRAHMPTIWLPHEAAGALRRLRQDGFALAVLTNGLPSVQARKVAALGLEPLVDHVIYADDHAPGGKPHAAAFAEALRCLGADPQRTLMVGDDVRCDVEGARAAGLRAVWLDRRGAGAPPACGADAVVTGIEQLPHLAASLLPQEAVHAA